MEICIKWTICRICLADEKLNDQLNMKAIFEDTSLSRQISECSGIEIKQSDNLPEKICKKCLVILKYALKFRSTCRSSHEYLQVMVQKAKKASNFLKIDKKHDKFDTDNLDISADFLEDEDDFEIFEGKEHDEGTEALLRDLAVGINVEMFKENATSLDVESNHSFPMGAEEELEEQKTGDQENDVDEENTKIPEENTEMQFKADDNEVLETTEDVLFVLDEDIKQEYDEDDDFGTEDEATQSDSTAITLATYSADNDEGLTMDSSPPADCTKQQQPSIRKYQKKTEKPLTRIFICDICGNHFQKRNLLNFHMKIHRNEKRYACEFCEKRFNSTCNLTAHMRVHTGEKPFECQFCQRKFSDRSTQKKHERIHTNEKPFTCGTCGKSFSLSTTLKAHEKIHSGEKPHKCETCAKSFTLPHQLKAHLSTHLHRILKSVK